MVNESEDRTDGILNLITEFEKRSSLDYAHKIGKFIASLDDPIEFKKKLFTQVFQSPTCERNDTISAIINGWSIATMIEDDISIVDKTVALRSFLDDKDVDSKFLEEWVNFVWGRKTAPVDFLEFIVDDIRNHKKATDEVKERLKDV
ncbi:MAG: hypothetical protein ACXAD7_22960 [Candidatus Kariarchaeaceae archaeon]|jgi:hypothetical protein